MIASTVESAKNAKYTDFAPRTVLLDFIPREQQHDVTAEQAQDAHIDATQPIAKISEMPELQDKEPGGGQLESRSLLGRIVRFRWHERTSMAKNGRLPLPAAQSKRLLCFAA